MVKSTNRHRKIFLFRLFYVFFGFFFIPSNAPCRFHFLFQNLSFPSRFFFSAFSFFLFSLSLLSIIIIFIFIFFICNSKMARKCWQFLLIEAWRGFVSSFEPRLKCKLFSFQFVKVLCLRQEYTYGYIRRIFSKCW